jgi:hypothetical protein
MLSEELRLCIAAADGVNVMYTFVGFKKYFVLEPISYFLVGSQATKWAGIFYTRIMRKSAAK